MAAPPQERSREGTEPRTAGRSWAAILTSRRIWPAARFVLGVGVLALALWALSSHRGELSGFSAVFGNLKWWWIPPALVVELASFVCFAGLQYTFLRSGGLVPPEGALLKMTVASQAITNSLPGGSAFSAVYGFRWFRRFGADDTLAAGSLVGTVVASVPSPNQPLMSTMKPMLPAAL